MSASGLGLWLIDAGGWMAVPGYLLMGVGGGAAGTVGVMIRRAAKEKPDDSG